MRQAKVAAAAVLSLLVVGVGVPTGADADSRKKSQIKQAAAIRKQVDRGYVHDKRNFLRRKQDAQRAQAVQMRLEGKKAAQLPIVELPEGDFADLENEGTDRIFVVITEFGDTRHPSYPDLNPDTRDVPAQRFDGPLHNQIPEPNRAVDNSTLWQADYNKAHYDNMYFERMREYFESQSSGRYSIDGDVTEWVKVPFNEARYGRNFCGDIVCNNTWFLIRDSLAYWTEQQLAAGMSMADIQAYLSTFDVQDRYDINGNGNFNEPDGFIDHFQIVHAGGDEAAGDPIYGEDAIWSHRWYAAINPGGPGGLPGVNIGEGGVSGGIVNIPNNPTGIWVGDYTIQPENGGLGVFAHEFGHDLGLPDLYDTSGNTGGAENSTGFWTLMSSGANIGDGGDEGIGDAPTDLGAWEKFQLGWLGCEECPGGEFFDVAFAGERSTHLLGPNNRATTKGVQALFTLLPEKKRIDVLGEPFEGEYVFYSSAGDDLNTTMTKSGVTGGPLTAKVRYDIEEAYDFLFLEASPNGSTWTPVVTNLSSPASEDQSGFNASGAGITGVSEGYDTGAYVDLTADVPAGTTAIRFRYQTDSALTRPGALIDNVTLNGAVIGTAETDAEGWVFDGFRRTTGTEESFHFNAYVSEYRNYRGYDTSLATAYNFGFLDSRPDWVEHFPYQDGMLVTYWDESFSDNNVGDHPGGGLILPVDANPTWHHSYDGHLLRPRILTFDSTFSRSAANRITVHKDSQPTTIPRPAKSNRVFNDLNDYWFADDGHVDPATGLHVGRYQPGWYSVNVPKTGTTMRLTKRFGKGNYLRVVVAPAEL